jgi:radical SAM protein with 4Fe4S-binding SPASM domain
MFKINPREKFELFKQNSCFCAAPWSLLYIYPDGVVNTCVAGQEVMGNLNHDSIEDILHSPARKQIQQHMLDQLVPSNCVGCSKLENTGTGSEKYQFLRNNYNTLLQDLDVNYRDPHEFMLGALDLHWSSLCDLKCVTCWAYQSSSIAQEQNVPVNHLPSDRANLLIDWIVKNQHTLQEIYLSGGEPTMIKYNLRLLEKIQKRSDLQIRVNSNLMWDQDNSVLAEILKFPNILFTCSADAVGQKFEYIRRDAKWAKFLENLNFLNAQKNVRIRINSVFFVLSAPDLADTVEFFKQNFNINDFTINQCEMEQTHLRARNLPEPVKKQCAADIADAIDRFSYDLNLVGQLKNCLAELDQPGTESYQEYFDKTDQLAGSNWPMTFQGLA